ncbi:CPBP family intramembrane glutamic endopeptidase [Methanobrevibacter sp.]|uniref:CPBP family intramembrane glutamic endopeptidase n=1 Tax=Methanobrevibacter sp. TaxID=66852 RepID=UPI00388F9E9A
MIRFNDYLDRLSIIKVLFFFLLVMLVLTLSSNIFNFYLGSLIFKFILYALMLLFFVYNFHQIDLKENSDDSFLVSLRNECNSIFDVSNLQSISFIVLANILFVSTVYFILKYLATLSIINFESPLFGDFSSLSAEFLFLYFITVVILSPIIEELLFRGIFLRVFNKELNNLALAIMITSILFGFCHGFGGILGAILFGICVSILYIKSRNILVPIFAHFLNNFISFIIALGGIEYFIQGNLIVIVLIVILAIASNFVLFRAILNEWPTKME